MPPKTAIEKSQSPSPDVAVFKIAGTLGFHEKDTLEKLLHECKKRGMKRLVFDVSELTSLGGGCARILRAESALGEMVIGVAGAKKTVIKFLVEKQDQSGIIICEAVPEAVSLVLRRPTRGRPVRPEDVVTPGDDDLVDSDSLNDLLGKTTSEAAQSPAPQLNDTPQAGQPEPASEPGDTPQAEQTEPASEPGDTPQAEQTEPASEPGDSPERGPEPAATEPAEVETSVRRTSDDGANAKELKRRIIQYNTLFSINSEFARIHDCKNLVDVFLLTTIAQVGVESAIFLEENRGYFVPVASKGIEATELRGLAVPGSGVDRKGWLEKPEVFAVRSAPIDDDVRAPLMAIGCEYVAPFIIYGEFRGILALGAPIRRAIDETTAEFLKLFVSQAAIAYQSISKFEEENERTLGLVQTLMSLIEENTAARGNTKMLSTYVYALAQRLHYPEEKMRDLMYGCALRDIGMIKVGHTIVRSPRELMPEEWEIIKRHPGEGAEMLRKMKFSEAARSIVLAHHERFNGEGYPNGTHGKDIPLGARIISVVESFTAMLQQRPTRPALTQAEAINTLKENWGMRYDPEIVNNFVAIVEQEMQSGDRVADRKFELFGV